MSTGVDLPGAGNTFGAMPGRTRIEDALDQAARQGPEEGLATVAGLRARLEALEALHVEKAVRAGWSWRRIAELLGVTKQAAHKKYARRVAEKVASGPAADEKKRLVVTGRARRSVRYAREEAADLGDSELGPEHLLLGLLRDEGGRAARALEEAGITLEAARGTLSSGRKAERAKRRKKTAAGKRLPVAPKARALMEESLREAVRRGDDHLGVEHLLLALVHDEGGSALRLLEDLGTSAGALEPLVDESE